MPRSVRSNTCRVFCTRFSPRAPTSSMPAVSMNSTGPIGSSSIGFSTGSVVVPAISETIETSCRVIAFSSDDLPALRRPNRPMCRRRPLGVLFTGISRSESASLFFTVPRWSVATGQYPAVSGRPPADSARWSKGRRRCTAGRRRGRPGRADFGQLPRGPAPCRGPPPTAANPAGSGGRRPRSTIRCERREAINVQLHAQSGQCQAVARPTGVGVERIDPSASIGRSLSPEIL